jgi:hypothetical protein
VSVAFRGRLTTAQALNLPTSLESPMNIDFTKIVIAAFWPIVALIIALAYRKGIGKLMGRLTRFVADRNQVVIEAVQKQEETLDQIQQKLESLTPQGKTFDDFRSSLLAAEDCINDFIESQHQKGHRSVCIDIKIKAIAMTYSWQYFILPTIPRLLERHPNLKINLNILLVSHEHLAVLDLQDSDITWAENSKQREIDIQNFCKHAADYRGRLSVTAKKYRNLPYWHGVLINNEQLFLGRTSWTFDRRFPSLNGGQNNYRYYNRSSVDGSARVELFNSWVQFFSDHSSELICSTHRPLDSQSRIICKSEDRL